MAFPNLIDPIYSDFFSGNDFYDDSWLHSMYSAPPLNSNDDYLEPRDITLDSSTSMEPETLSIWEIEDAAFNFDSMFGNDSISSIDHSRTPSLCDDADSPSSIPKSVEPSASPEASSKRKRGRPWLTRDDSESSYGDPPKSRKSGVNKRQPHHEVERKYREGLNAGLERLRMAIPTLLRLDSQDVDAPIRPSKATVLASAIDYIRQMEVERDRLQKENEALKTGKGWRLLGFD